MSSPVILILGLLGAAAAYFYTRKPFCFKYRGYGMPLVFLMFGPLPALGAYYLNVRSLSPLPALLSIPVGLLTAAILHANDLRDIGHDAKAGIRSFAMALGAGRARLFYIGLIAASFLSVPLFILFGLLGAWSLLVFLSLPIAAALIRNVSSAEPQRALDHQTAALQLAFGVLLLISVLLQTGALHA
jgi:1,4-dihydroxy-2-naphthoate octaprenyltransferase